MARDFWSSKKIAERYEFLADLGSGGFGAVYKAHDRILDKTVAIKVLRENLSSQTVLRFQQEAKLSGRLKHPNIVGVLDFGVTDENRPYLVMDYLDGRSLADVIESNGALNVSIALLIFQQIAAAIRHSHSCGILHRDLKPSNIILMDRDSGVPVVKVVDFGLATLMDRDDRMTPTRRGIGSPLYMPPEQAEGHAVDERTDIYSMGCLMYEAIGGTPPFVGETALETLLKHKSTLAVPLSEKIDDERIEDIDEVIAKCLEKEAEDRYQDFGSLSNDLERLQLKFGETAPSAGVDLAELNEQQSTIADKVQYDHVTVSPPVTPLLVRWLIPLGGLLVVGALILVFSGVSKIPKVQEAPPSAKQSVGGAASAPESETNRFLPLLPHTRLTPSGFKELFDSRREGDRLEIKSFHEVDENDLAVLSGHEKIGSLDLMRGSTVNGIGFHKYLKNVSIEELHMEKSLVNDSSLKYVTQIKGLRGLFLHDSNLLSRLGLRDALKYCPELEILSISGEKLKEDYLNELSPLNLKVIVLRHFKLTDQGVEQIFKMSELNDVLLSDVGLTESALKALRKRSRSSVSYSYETMKLTDKEVDAILKIPAYRLRFSQTIMSRNSINKLLRDKRLFVLEVVSSDYLTPQQIKSMEASVRTRSPSGIFMCSIKNLSNAPSASKLKNDELRKYFEEQVNKQGLFPSLRDLDQ